MAPRFFVDTALQAQAALGDQPFALPAGAARHVQVLRLQPGAALTLFDGRGGEWSASVVQMGRSEVTVQLGAHAAIDRELPIEVTLAVGMPANDRMDALVEKATELGVAAVQPLMCERAVLRLTGERADKKVAHWQGVALAACEQSGRTRVPRIEPVRSALAWLQGLAMPPAVDAARWMLSLNDARTVGALPTSMHRVLCFSGPEGGLTVSEEAAAREAGFSPVSLGPRVLRADTAPLALLALLALR